MANEPVPGLDPLEGVKPAGGVWANQMSDSRANTEAAMIMQETQLKLQAKLNAEQQQNPMRQLGDSIHKVAIDAINTTSEFVSTIGAKASIEFTKFASFDFSGGGPSAPVVANAPGTPVVANVQPQVIPELDVTDGKPQEDAYTGDKPTGEQIKDANESNSGKVTAGIKGAVDTGSKTATKDTIVSSQGLDESVSNQGFKQGADSKTVTAATSADDNMSDQGGSPGGHH